MQLHQLGTRQWCNDAVFTNLEQGNDAMMQFSPTWNKAMMQFSEHEASWRNELHSEIRCRELWNVFGLFSTYNVFASKFLLLCSVPSLGRFHSETSMSQFHKTDRGSLKWIVPFGTRLWAWFYQSHLCHQSARQRVTKQASLRYLNSKVQVRKNKTLVFSRRKSKRELNEFPAPSILWT